MEERQIVMFASVVLVSKEEKNVDITAFLNLLDSPTIKIHTNFVFTFFGQYRRV